MNKKIPAYQIDEILRNELNKIENQTALTAFLYQQNFINKLQNENQQLKEKLQK
ncbi:MAG: hypothetical protein IK062_06865 [Selenomonadaceae bacterium]|nr:hypothetical protein [Selenomonadaceae bacterium]